MTAVESVRLAPLMRLSEGRPEIAIALIDGPVALSHPDLAGAAIRELEGEVSGGCRRADSPACTHGTSVAGMLVARRGSVAPAICPGCTLLVRPIFAEAAGGHDTPSATPEQLAGAIAACVDAGARVINISAAMIRSSLQGERRLADALHYAAQRSALIVCAAGNQASVGSSVITSHSWVLPVAASNNQGRPLGYSNLGSSIGRRGLSAPGENIATLGSDGKPRVFSGTSAAAPFVTGTIGLLWSEFPAATATDIRLAVTHSRKSRRETITPPLLDSWAAYQTIARVHGRKAS